MKVIRSVLLAAFLLVPVAAPLAAPPAEHGPPQEPRSARASDLAAIASQPRPAAFPDAVDLRSAQIIDLTWAFDEKTVYWPNAPSGFVKKIDAFGKTPGGWFYSSNTICTPEHGGTHFDAPVHFGEGKPSTAEVPLRQLVGPAVVIDVAEQATADRDYRLALADVQAWEARNPRRTLPHGGTGIPACADRQECLSHRDEHSCG